MILETSYADTRKSTSEIFSLKSDKMAPEPARQGFLQIFLNE